MNVQLRQGLAALLMTITVTSPVYAHDGKHSETEVAFGHPGKASQVSRTINLHMADTMRFDPDHFEVRQGETIRLHVTNDGKVDHEFVLGDKAELSEHAAMMRAMPDMRHSDANAVSVAPGHTADLVWTFSKAGNFLYACLIPGHRESGMEGHVTVNGKDKR